MEPEIARRCTDCGAAVRGGSLFCPQCGKALKRHGADAGDIGGAAATEPATEGPPARRATDPGRKASVIVPQAGETEEGGVTPSPQPTEDMAATLPSSVEGRRRAEIITRRPEDEDDGVRHRRRSVRSAAREAVEEKLSPRVEKLRHASNVMLEEAAYDPSLRFVLVAAAAVILSLLLLLLNYLLG